MIGPVSDESPELLACIDLSDASEAVLAEAARLAESMGARIHLLHVAGPEPDFVGYDRAGGAFDRDRRATELTEERARIHDLASGFETARLAISPLLVMGPTVETILAEAEKLDPVLIVVGSHGHGALHRALVGSTTDALLRHAPCPVTVVPIRGDR